MLECLVAAVVLYYAEIAAAISLLSPVKSYYYIVLRHLIHFADQALNVYVRNAIL
jgi:hypothetical protein